MTLATSRLPWLQVSVQRGITRLTDPLPDVPCPVKHGGIGSFRLRWPWDLRADRQAEEVGELRLRCRGYAGSVPGSFAWFV